MSELIEKAKQFAKTAHAGQKRWSGADYYEEHLLAVYDITSKFIENNQDILKEWYRHTDITSEKILAASLLHDIVEDTTVTHKDILQEFGQDVALIVNILTRPRDMEYAEYIFSIVDGIWEHNIVAALIKMADLTHNSSNFPIEKRNNKYSKYLLSMRLIQNYLEDYEF